MLEREVFCGFENIPNVGAMWIVYVVLSASTYIDTHLPNVVLDEEKEITKS